MHHRIFSRSQAAFLAAFSASLFLVKAPLQAQTYVYWDINGVTAGAGGATPAGEWNGSNAFWNTSATGEAGTLAAWTAGNIAVFAAGEDATGIYTVGITGTHDIRGLTFEEGAVTLQGGTLNLTAASVFNVAPTLTTTLHNVALTGNFGATLRGKGKLVLTGSTSGSFTGDFRIDGGLVELNTTSTAALGSGNITIQSVAGSDGNANPSTLRLLAANQIADTAHVTIFSQQYKAALFDLNGFSETIGGLTVACATGTPNVGVVTGAGGVLTVAGDIFLHNDRAGNGNNPRDVLITGTGSRSSAAPDSGILDLGNGVRTITVQGRAATLFADSDATIETTIRNGGIIKAGPQMLILLGTNTYLGGTTINEGSLRLGGGTGSATGSIVGDVINNALMEFNRSNAYTFAGNITGTGSVNKLAGGVLRLTGVNSYTGLTQVLAGTLEVERLGMAGSATGTNVGTQSAIVLGGDTASVGLTYVGAGETTDKILRYASTTGTLTLGASGTGAIVYQSAVEFSAAGNKTLTLTGTNTGDNTLLGIIANPATGELSLVKSGVGTWLLGGQNTYTGTTTITGGTLRLTGTGAIPQTGLIVQNGTFDIAGSTDLTLVGDPDLKLATAELTNYALMMGGGAAGSSATVNIATGRLLNLDGNLAFTAAGNNLPATISGGTLNLGGAQRYFVVNNSTNADPDLTVTSAIIGTAGSMLTKSGNGSLALSTGVSVSAVRVNAGRLNLGGATNVITNSLQVGINDTGSAYYATAGGQLAVGSGTGDTLDVGVMLLDQTYSFANPSGTLDLRGSNSLNVNVSTVRVGVHPSTGAGTGIPSVPSLNGATTPVSMSPSANALYLPTNSTITALTSFVVGDAASASVTFSVDAHRVEFGEGQSLVKTPAMYIGYRKGSGTGTIRAGGTLTLQGVTDGARAILGVGHNAVNTGAATVNTLNLSSGTFIAQLSSLTVGWKSAGSSTTAGSSTGTLTLGTSSSNAVDVSGKITVGYIGGSQASSTTFGRGTLNMGGGIFSVGGDVELAIISASGSSVTNANFTSAGTLNLTGGTFTVNGNIITSTDTLNRNTATVNLTGGILDMTGGSIGATGALVTFKLESGGLRGLAEYNGGAALNKTTTGLVTLGGVNTYTGTTLINAGTLEVLAGSTTGQGNTTIQGAGAVLAGEGTISANASMTNGSIRPGANGGLDTGMLSFNGSLTLNATSGSTLNLTISGATGIADLAAYTVSQIPDIYDFVTYNSETHNLGNHDLLRVAGTLTWNSGTQMVVEAEDMNYAYGQVFNLLDWAGLMGGTATFGTGLSNGGIVNEYLSLPSLTGTGFQWDLSLLNSHGVLVLVPEPGRAAFMLLGLGFLGMRRRRC